MADETKGFVLEQPGQPVTPSATEKPVETQSGTPVQQASDSPLAIEEMLRRKQQSEKDKKNAEIAKAVSTLIQNGFIQSAEQVLGMNPPAVEQSQSAVSPVVAQPAAQPGAQTQGLEQVSDPVLRKAYRIMEEEGGGLIAKDEPEFALIDQKTDDPEEFLASVRAASKAKAERTGNVGNLARVATLANGGGTNVPSHASLSATDGLNSYFSEFRRKNGAG